MEVDVLTDKEQHLTLRVYNQNNDVDIVITLVYAKCTLIERRYVHGFSETLDNGR